MGSYADSKGGFQPQQLPTLKMAVGDWIRFRVTAVEKQIPLRERPKDNSRYGKINITIESATSTTDNVIPIGRSSWFMDDVLRKDINRTGGLRPGVAYELKRTAEGYGFHNPSTMETLRSGSKNESESKTENAKIAKIGYDSIKGDLAKSTGIVSKVDKVYSEWGTLVDNNMVARAMAVRVLLMRARELGVRYLTEDAYIRVIAAQTLPKWAKSKEDVDNMRARSIDIQREVESALKWATTIAPTSPCAQVDLAMLILYLHWYESPNDPPDSGPYKCIHPDVVIEAGNLAGDARRQVRASQARKE